MSDSVRRSGRIRAGASSAPEKRKLDATEESPPQAPKAKKAKSASVQARATSTRETPTLSTPSNNNVDINPNIQAALQGIDNDDLFAQLLNGLQLEHASRKAQSGVESVEQGSAADLEAQAVEEPAVEEPAVEEPAVEEPAVETPVVEAPAAAVPAVEPSPAAHSPQFFTFTPFVPAKQDLPLIPNFSIDKYRDVKDEIKDLIYHYFCAFKDLEEDQSAQEEREVTQQEGLAQMGEASTYVCPFYCNGFSPHFPLYTRKELDVMADHGVPSVFMKDLPNFNVRIPFEKKSITALYCKSYYSHHTFVFNDARSCGWFFERIGNTNLSHIRVVVFNLGSGFFTSTKYRDDDDICEELRWISVFKFLRSKHHFTHCVIRFVGMKELGGRQDVGDADKYFITQGRCRLVSVLSTLRGMKQVLIENQDCEFLGLAERQKMAEDMVEPAGTFVTLAVNKRAQEQRWPLLPGL